MERKINDYGGSEYGTYMTIVKCEKAIKIIYVFGKT